MDKIRVLIAEAEVGTEQSVKKFVEEDGYQVEHVKSGNHAWQTLQRKGAPKLLILDCIMPGMNGLDVCRRLRETDETFRTYVILLTSVQEKQAIVKGLEFGADDCLVKPVNPEELLARIRAGERILAMQLQLLKRIKDQASLLLNAQKEKMGSEGMETKGDEVSYLGLSSVISSFRPITEFDKIALRTLKDMGFNRLKFTSKTDSPTGKKSDYSAWSALTVKPLEVWLDLRLEVTKATIERLFLQSAGIKADSAEDFTDFIAEILNVLEQNVKAAFQKLGLETYTPMVPKGVPSASPLLPKINNPKQAIYTFSNEDVAIDFTIIENPSPILEKNFEELGNLQLLVEPVLSPKKTVLLNKGNVLDQNYIRKLKNIMKGQEDMKFSVMEPSLISKSLCSY